MTIKEMHYDFKVKFNKIDSQQRRNLLVPEIDWLLNEATAVFIGIIAFPRKKTHLGFEKNSHWGFEDIYTIVEEGTWTNVTNNVIPIPAEYMHYAKGRVKMTSTKCPTPVEGNLLVFKHEDLVEDNTLYNTSYNWREAVALFNSKGIEILPEPETTVTQVKLGYIKKPRYIHNAQDFNASGYKLPSGVTLTGTVDSELPAHVHREIVDIAVMLAANNIQVSDLQAKIGKIGFDQII